MLVGREGAAMGPAPGRDFFISCTASGDTGLPVAGCGCGRVRPGPAGQPGCTWIWSTPMSRPVGSRWADPPGVGRHDPTGSDRDLTCAAGRFNPAGISGHEGHRPEHTPVWEGAAPAGRACSGAW